MRILYLALLLSVGCGGPKEEPCEATIVTTFQDSDGDGYGSVGSDEETCGIPADRSIQAGDCDDDQADVFPGNIETCDGLDNDCTGVADDDLPVQTYHPDVDGDGFGDFTAPVDSCMELENHVLDGSDCDDGDGSINANAIEICDEIDNDCDGLIDDDDPDVDSDTFLEWYRDQDGDGFGGGAPDLRCDGGALGLLDGSDCDDTLPEINPNGL